MNSGAITSSQTNSGHTSSTDQQAGRQRPDFERSQAVATLAGVTPYSPGPVEPGPQAIRLDKPLQQYHITGHRPGEQPFQLSPSPTLFMEIPALPELTWVVQGLREPWQKKLENLIDVLQGTPSWQNVDTCKNLRSYAIHKGAPADFRTFIETVLVLLELRCGNYAIVDELPAEDRHSFIRWHLEVAKQVQGGSSMLKTHRDLELYCLRKAADAGSAWSREILIRRLLLDGSTRLPTLYLPVEALEHLKARVMDSDSPLESRVNSRQDRTLAILIALVANPTEPARDALAEELIEQGTPRAMALAIGCYVAPCFGRPNLDRALACVQSIDPELKQQPAIRYWHARALLKSGEPQQVEQALRLLEQGVSQGCLAATGLSAEFYLHTKNILKLERLVKLAHDTLKPLVFLCPDVANSLHVGGLLPVFIEPRREVERAMLTGRAKEEFMEALERASLDHCSSEMRASSLAFQVEEKVTDQANFLAIGSEAVTKLPLGAKELLRSCRFSQDPEIMVFLYLDQILETGCGDEQIIEQALKRDPVVTCCNLLALGLTTTERLSAELLELLLSKIDGVEDLPARWRRRNRQTALYGAMLHGYGQLRDPGKALRVLSGLAVCAGKLEQLDQTGIYSALKGDYGRYLEAQGKVAEANQMYKRHYQEELRKKTGQQVPCVADDYRVLRRDLPAYYWQLNSLAYRCTTPAETQGTVNRLIHIFEQMADDPNLAIHRQWLESCYQFLQFSPEHLTHGQIQALFDSAINVNRNGEKLLCQLHGHSCSLLRSVASRLPEHNELATCIEQSWQEAFGAVGSGSSAAEILDTSYAQRMRLPNQHQHRDYLMEHHLEADLRAAETLEQRLTLLERCLDAGDYDPAVLITLMFADHQELPVALHDRVARAITSLVPKLLQAILQAATSARESADYQFYRAMLMPEKKKYHGLDNQSQELMETIRWRLANRSPVQLAKIAQDSDSKYEYDLYLPALLASIPLEKRFEPLAQRLCLVEFFREYSAYLADKGLTCEEREYFLSLWKEGPTNSDRLIIRLFAGYLLGKDCRKEITKIVPDPHFHLQYRVQMLCLSHGLSLLSSSEIIGLIQYVHQDSVEGAVVAALVVTQPEELRSCYNQFQAFLVAKKLNEPLFIDCPASFYVAIGQKALAIGEEWVAFCCFRGIGCHHGLALLEWKYSLEAQEPLSPERLLEAASHGVSQVICRLVDCLLKVKYPKPLTAQRCYRYLLAPTLVPCPEKELYRRIAKFVGLGCERDPAMDTEHIYEALDCQSPIPALRLSQLILRGWFANKEMLGKVLVIFAKKLICYHGNLPQQLLLSDPDSEWQTLIGALQQQAHIDTGNSQLLHRAAQRLERSMGAAAVPVKVVQTQATPVKKTSSTPQKGEKKPKVKPRKKSNKKTAISQGRGGEHRTAAQVLSKQAQLELREEQLVTKISRLVHHPDYREMPDSVRQQRLVTQLLALEQLQGRRFPDISDQGLAKLLDLIPCTGERAQLVLRLFQGIGSKALADDRLSRQLDSFLVRYDVQCNQGKMDPLVFNQDKQALLQMLPRNMVVANKSQMAFLTLVQSYWPNLPEKLRGILTRTENAPLLQRFLLERPQLTPDTELNLYLAYKRAKDGVVFQDIPAAKALQLKIFADLAPYSADQIKYFILGRPHLGVRDQKRIVTSVNLAKQRQLLDDKEIAKIVSDGTYEEAENPRHRDSVEKLLDKVKAMVSSKSDKKGGYSLWDRLTVYACLVKEGRRFEAKPLAGQMRQLAKACLDQPLAQWNGNKERFAAMAIMDTLG